MDGPMNSFAMIFGHCVWIPPSPKAALIALGLFFGIGIDGEPDIAAHEAILASQYISAGKTPIQARKKSPRSTPASEPTRRLPRTEIIRRM